MLVYFLEKGYYDCYLWWVRSLYVKVVVCMIDWVIELFFMEIRVSWFEGGFVLWLELFGWVNIIELVEWVLDVGVNFVLGVLFFVFGKFDYCLCLNCVVCWDNWVEWVLVWLVVLF